MAQPQFTPPPVEHDLEIQHRGKTYKSRYHFEHENIVVSHQGASKMAPQGPDNESLAKSLLGQIVAAKHAQE